MILKPHNDNKYDILLFCVNQQNIHWHPSNGRVTVKVQVSFSAKLNDKRLSADAKPEFASSGLTSGFIYEPNWHSTRWSQLNSNKTILTPHIPVNIEKAHPKRFHYTYATISVVRLQRKKDDENCVKTNILFIIINFVNYEWKTTCKM